MSYAANVHVAVYQALDNVLTSTVASPGAKTEIHSIIDELRSASALRELVRMAEEISVLIHQLESALRQRDLESELAARTRLRNTAAAWLNFRLLN